jgi:hypothetical protein
VAHALGARSNVALHVTQVADYFSQPGAESFDIVIVDHLDEARWSRADSVKRAMQFAQIIVLDDSDREAYQGAMVSVDDWKVERYWSLRPSPLAITETTLLLRRHQT